MAVYFVIKVCCSAEADHQSNTPSGDSHDFTLSPGVLLKTGNVREYMTFPLQGADSECGEPGMIEIDSHRRKQEPADESFLLLRLGAVALRCLADSAGGGQTRCHSNTNSGNRTFSLYHHVRRLRINHVKATMHQLCPQKTLRTVFFSHESNNATTWPGAQLQRKHFNPFFS